MNENSLQSLDALVVEDDAGSRRALSHLMTRRGFNVQSTGTVGDARRLRLSRPQPYDLAILDVRLPDGLGTGLLETDDLSRFSIVVTAYPQLETSLDALRGEALDYLTKPINTDHLDALLQRVRQRAETRSLPDDDPLVASSAASRSWKDELQAAARADRPVMILGAAGSGKTFSMAYLLRQRGVSPKSTLWVDAADEAVIERLQTALLPGRRTRSPKTVVLQHVESLRPDQQAKLRQLLDRGAEDRPLLSAISLDEDAGSATISRSLRDRLGQFTVTVPSLTERLNDLPRLIKLRLDHLAKTHGETRPLEAGLLKKLIRYRWPGNVRQLFQVVDQGYLRSQDEIRAADLPAEVLRGMASDGPAEQQVVTTEHVANLVGRSLAEIESALFRATLEACNNDKTAAAQQLGVSRRTIYNRLRDL